MLELLPDDILHERYDNGVLVCDNCFNIFPLIEDKSIDIIICDLPYGKTKNLWDSVLDLERLWLNYMRIIKPTGAIILFGQDKFSARLMLSNEKYHRYNLIWEKTTPTGHLNAKRMPLRSHEDILIFYKSLPTYNPQKTTGHPRKVSTSHHKRNSMMTTNYGKHDLHSYDSTERYPKSVWKFPSDKQKGQLHPTQKPLALIEMLVKSYSNDGDLILDNCMGSGTLPLACKNLNRKFIGIDSETKYFDIAKKRLSSLDI